eukprot:TRINITY_DN26891_c0_g1_i1.p1 TRINITY_DN26891_c0_g1~~TRINITY_DN26891_c0_g1_i1.p1  ORF type:complete len:399 (+),score=137.17 TRINITY_DN26891_c0_g1_i1:110-1306(+)
MFLACDPQVCDGCADSFEGKGDVSTLEGWMDNLKLQFDDLHDIDPADLPGGLDSWSSWEHRLAEVERRAAEDEHKEEKELLQREKLAREKLLCAGRTQVGAVAEEKRKVWQEVSPERPPPQTPRTSEGATPLRQLSPGSPPADPTPELLGAICEAPQQATVVVAEDAAAAGTEEAEMRGDASAAAVERDLAEPQKTEEEEEDKKEEAVAEEERAEPLLAGRSHEREAPEDVEEQEDAEQQEELGERREQEEQEEQEEAGQPHEEEELPEPPKPHVEEVRAQVVPVRWQVMTVTEEVVERWNPPKPSREGIDPMDPWDEPALSADCGGRSGWCRAASQLFLPQRCYVNCVPFLARFAGDAEDSQGSVSTCGPRPDAVHMQWQEGPAVMAPRQIRSLDTE